MEALELATLEQGNIDPYSIYTPVCNDIAAIKRRLGGRYVSFYINIFNFLLNNMTPRYKSLHAIVVVNQNNVILITNVILKL